MENSGALVSVRRILLLSDYGDDGFAHAAILGAIYRTFPNALVNTISHSITPLAVREAAFTLAYAAPEFPEGTIFCVLVDPDSEADLGCIAAESVNGLHFVAPNNGVLTFALDALGCRAVYLIEGTTRAASGFRGRDALAPVAARLACGDALERIGVKVTDWARLSEPIQRAGPGWVAGEIALRSAVGDLFSTITEDLLKQAGLAVGDKVLIQIADRSLSATLVRSYHDVPLGACLCRVNYQGFLELAIHGGNLTQVIEQPMSKLVEIRASRY